MDSAIKKPWEQGESVVGPTIAARFFGVATRTFHEWHHRGLPKEEGGKYDLSSCAQWLIARRNSSCNSTAYEELSHRLEGVHRACCMALDLVSGQLDKFDHENLCSETNGDGRVDAETVKGFVDRLQEEISVLRAILPKMKNDNSTIFWHAFR